MAGLDPDYDASTYSSGAAGVDPGYDTSTYGSSAPAATKVVDSAGVLRAPTGDVSEWRTRAAKALGRNEIPYIAKQLGINPDQVTYDPETANWNILHPNGQREPLFPDRGSTTYNYSISEPGLEGIDLKPLSAKNNALMQGGLGAAAEVPNVVGTTKGATIGTLGGLITGPGAVVTGILGAGAGNLAAHGAKQALGEYIAPGSGERPGGLGDFAEGAFAELGGRALGASTASLWDRAKAFGHGSLLRPLTATEKALRMAASDTTLSPETAAGLESVFKGGADAPVFTSPNVRALLNDAAQQSQPARNFIASQVQKMDPENQMLFGALKDIPGMVTGMDGASAAGAARSVAGVPGQAGVKKAGRVITNATNDVAAITRELGSDPTPVDTTPLLEFINQKLADAKAPGGDSTKVLTADGEKYLTQAKQALTQSADPEAIRATLAKVAPGTGSMADSSSAALERVQGRIQAEAEGIRAEADPYFTPAVKGEKIPMADYENMLSEFKAKRDSTAGVTQEAYDKLIRYLENATNGSGDGSVSLTANGLNQLRSTFWSLRKKAPSSAGSDFKDGYEILKSYLPGTMQEGLEVSRVGYGKLDALDKTTLGRLAQITDPDQFRNALFKLEPDEFAGVVKAMPDEAGPLVRDYINNAASGMSDTNAKSYASRLYNKLMGSENQRNTLKAALGDDYQHVAGALEGAAEAPKPMPAGPLIADLRLPAEQIATTGKSQFERDTAKQFRSLLDQQLIAANPTLAQQLPAHTAAVENLTKVRETMGGLLENGAKASDPEKIRAAKALVEQAQPGSWQAVQSHLIDQLTSSQKVEGAPLAKRFFGSPEQAARWKAIVGPEQYQTLRQGVLAYDEVSETLGRLSSASTLKPGMAAANEGQSLAAGPLSRITTAARMMFPGGKEQQYRAVLWEMKRNAPAIVKAFTDPGNKAVVQRLASMPKTDPNKFLLMGRFISYAIAEAASQPARQMVGVPVQKGIDYTTQKFNALRNQYGTGGQ